MFLGLRLLLPCVQLSARPCGWEHPPDRHTRQHHSQLEVVVSTESLGRYVCTCQVRRKVCRAAPRWRAPTSSLTLNAPPHPPPQEGGPGVRDPTPCRRAEYQLTLEDPTAGGTVAAAGSRQVVAVYVLLFCLGLVLGMFLLYFLTNRGSRPCQGHHLPDNSVSSEKGRDLLGSSATPQSPSSATLLSEGFTPTEKRNGMATATTTSSTLHSSHGNGGSHYSGTLVSSASSNGHGNSLYANCKRSSSGGSKFPSEILAADMLDGRTAGRGKPRGVEREGREGEEVERSLQDGAGEDMKGLEEALASFPRFKSPAPLAKCEESSI